MNLNELKEVTGELSKDVKINLGNLLKVEGAPGLKENQIFSIALSCAYALKDKDLVEALCNSDVVLSDSEVQAAKTASIMMAMNNVYYRFLHLVEDKEFSKLPAKLRMTSIGAPGVEKIDFELYCLAVSALSGCGMCINAHADVVLKSGLTHEGIQSAVRIASVINSAAQTLAVRRLS